MKNIFLLHACFMCMHATAQLHIARKAKVTEDTFRCAYGILPYVRYDKKTIEREISAGNPDFSFIMQMQRTFDRCQLDIITGNEYVLIEDTKNDLFYCKKVDVSSFRNEFAFYNKYNETKKQEKEDARQKTWREERLTKAREDSINKAIAKNQRIIDSAKAHVEDSVLQIEYAEKQKKDAIQEQKDMMARVQRLTSKYGSVTAKKLLMNKVWIGMTNNMLIDEFGEPVTTRVAYTGNGKKEVSVFTGYPDCVTANCTEKNIVVTFKNNAASYIYFEDRN